MGIRSTRSGLWQCGDLSAPITIERPSVRDVIAHDGECARAQSAYQALGASLDLLARLIVSLGPVRRGDAEPVVVSPSELLDALSAEEIQSLLTWAIEPPSPPSAA